MKRILVVDDDPILLESLQRHFRPLRHEWEVSTARNGREAMRSLREQPVDLVVTDILMPEQDGIETITLLRRRQPWVKIVAMSGGGRHVSMETLDYARLLGAHETLAKPFPPGVLIETIRSLIGAADDEAHRERSSGRRSGSHDS